MSALIGENANNNNNENDISDIKAIASKWIVSSLPSSNKKVSSSSSSQTSTTARKTRLILHLDINETILLGDPAGGDSRHDSVQKMLAKSAFCQVPASYYETSGTKRNDSNQDWKLLKYTETMEPTHWWNGQEIGKEADSSHSDGGAGTIPPLYTGWEWPDHCVPYYRTAYKKQSKTFCEHAGKIYQPVLEACEHVLEGGHILPAFYTTLEYLIQQKRSEQQPFSLVFRTFGSDIDQIATVVTEFAQGKHPDYPHIQFPALELPETNLYQGRWKQQDPNDASTRIYQLWNRDETEIVASGDAEILQFLEDHSCCGIRDDYDFWKENDWDPTAGKPVWIPSAKVSPNDDNNKQNRHTGDDNSYFDHHLFFDDNIHNLPNDGIACVRKQNDDGSFVTLDANTMHTKMHGIHMVRVPTVEPVLNPRWYIDQIQKAQSRLVI